jgi:ABC-2 type transport system ATP-binding protein
MTDHPAVEATALTKSYGELPVLAGVDLAVQPGTVLALLGPNGAGKTTTVRILATLTAPDGGTARVAGYDVLADRGQVRRRISLTGQYVAVDELQTGEENLRFIARLRGLDRAAVARRSAELLDRFDLAEAAGRRAGTYSGGMRRRLDLAMSLVSAPEVIFLDEPTTGLDPRSRQALWDTVRELVAAGTTVLLTTQYLEEADRLADRIALMNGGRIVAEDTPAELKRTAAEHRLVVTAAGRDANERILARLRGAGHSAPGAEPLAPGPEPLTLELPTDGGAAAVRRLLDELDPGRTDVAAFAVRTATLDDVFLSLTAHPSPEPAHV